MVIRRYLAIGAAALTVGLAVFLRAGGTALAVLLGLSLALGLIKALRPLWRPLLCGLLAAALMGGLYAWRYTAAEQLTGCELPFTGTVLEVSPYTAHRSTIYARVGGQHRVIDLTAYLPEEETPLAGERIAGTLTITGAESEGETLLLSGGVALKARQLTAEPAEERFSPLGWLLRLRRQTIEQLNALGEGESAALVTAMLTADTADLPAGLRTALSRAGISHLLAVSGLHLSILLAVCGKLGDLLLWSRKRKALYSGLCCLTMIVLAGFSASVLRAALMAGLALGAPLRGRRGDGLTGLGFAAAILLLCNPAAVWELSFLLSCGATLGILLLARPLARLWPAARRSRWGSLLWESACVSLAAQLGTLPITALSFGYLPAYSLLSNLLVLPLVYGVMVFAFLTLPCLLLGVGVYPFTVARCFAGGIAALARGIAGLPGAVLALCGSLAMDCAGYFRGTAAGSRAAAHQTGPTASAAFGMRRRGGAAGQRPDPAKRPDLDHRCRHRQRPSTKEWRRPADQRGAGWLRAPDAGAVFAAVRQPAHHGAGTAGGTA